MMDYEKIKGLIEFISTYTTNVKHGYIDNTVVEENFNWNASLFLAKAIYLARHKKQAYTLEQFEEFKNLYEQNAGKLINTDNLFQRFWLRNVLGTIRIAGKVVSACYKFRSISNYKNELIFLAISFPEGVDKNNKLSQTEFDQIRNKYEKENKLKLNDNGLYALSLRSVSNGFVTTSHISYYYKPYLEHWEEFEFISAYNDQISNDGELKLGKEAFEQLHHSFKTFYSTTPTIQRLIDEKLITFENNSYILNFRNTEVHYWQTLSNSIAAHYWQLLIDDNSFSSDEERVNVFLNQILCEGLDWPSNFVINLAKDIKNRFLDAAFNLVINEPDLDGIDAEFKKVSIDSGFSSHEVELLFQNSEKIDDFTLNNSDHFELLNSLDRWETKAKITYLEDQFLRNNISFLIKVIVSNDYETERDKNDDSDKLTIHHYKRVFALLEKSLNKPTLLWDIRSFIIMCRREIIPYLIADPNYTSLAFQLIDEIINQGYIPVDGQNYLSKKLWTKSIDLALHTIRSVDEGNASKFIFQIYRQLNAKKYNDHHIRLHGKTEKLSFKQKEEKEIEVLSLIENCPLDNGKRATESQQYLIPEIFNDLVKLFIEIKLKPLYNNGTVRFPLLQWDGMVWLMKCSTFWKYKKQFEGKTSNVHILANSFLKLYLERIEVTEVKKYNYIEKKEENDLPLWNEKIERLEYIEWIYPAYFMNKIGILGNLLAPKFFFEPTTDQFHKKNSFTADKLRTHTGVLIHVLQKLIRPSIPYGFEEDDLHDIKSRVEQQIIDYLKVYSKDVPEQGRIDIFDYNKEWGFNSSEKEALLPQISRALNWFDKKERIIETIIQSNDIAKILAIAEWITSEGIKKKLIKKINQDNLKKFLKSSHWIPQVQQALILMKQYPELINRIEEITDFWETEVSNRKHEYQIELYQTRLLLAYFKEDEKALNTISEPENPAIPVSEGISYADHRRFYKALIIRKKDPETSFNIFDQLCTQYPQYTAFAINRMAAKIDIAKQEDNNLMLYREALEEWEAYISRQKELDEKLLGSTYSANKLLILLKLANFVELEKTYGQLELPYQMMPDLLEIKVDSLIVQNRIEEALILLEKAESYHSYSDIKEVEFVRGLKTKVRGIDNVEEMRVYYNRIFDSPPEKLIKIFPSKLNGKVDVIEFITKEVIIATSKMLDKLNALPHIEALANTSKENRYNDLIQLALEARLSVWGWSVKDQTRKAYSESGKDLGAIDLDIQDFNQNSFITCEAFILRDAVRVQSHLQKLIAHYTHNRKAFLVLTYFVGKHSDFEDEWNKYYQETLTSIEYPVGYELNSDLVLDVTKEFEQDKNGIKLCKSILKSGSIIYNVFININYKVN